MRIEKQKPIAKGETVAWVNSGIRKEGYVLRTLETVSGARQYEIEVFKVGSAEIKTKRIYTPYAGVVEAQNPQAKRER